MPSSAVFDSLSLDTAHVADTLGVMIQKERKIARGCCTNYFQQYSFDSSAVVDEQDRMKMVDWCYKIVDECKLDRECVAMAMTMVDQFLSKPTTHTLQYLSSHNQYQLLSITALYTTIKVRESVAFGSDVFAVISNGLYSQQEIEDMEMTLLTGLQWTICTPTSLQMANHILSLILPHVNLTESSWAYLLDEVLFQTEYAVRDYELSAMSRPSTVALACILNALGGMDDKHQACQAILQALLFVIDEFGEQLASPGELLSTRNRLQSLINADDEDSIEPQEEEEEACVDEDFTPNSIAPRRVDSSYTDVRQFGSVDNNSPPKYVSFEQSFSHEEGEVPRP